MESSVNSVAPARRVALAVLRTVRERDAFAQPVFEAALRDNQLDDRDRALAHRLVFGALQMQGTLDDAIDRFVARPSTLEASVRDALRLSAYEILFSAASPRAVVHQGVELVRSVRPAASGLANAVLRRLAEAAGDFPWGDPSDPPVRARLTGHPVWLVDRWVSELGRDRAYALLEADNLPAPLYVAHNPFRGTLQAAVERLGAEGADPGPGPLPGCIVCRDAPAAVRSGALRDGDVIVADAGAQMAPYLLGAHPRGTVLDVAAGRGTKSVLIQATSVRAGAPASVHAYDVHPFKTRVLRERMGRLSVPGVVAHTCDATTPEALRRTLRQAQADAALVDAPCSGLGTLRRHPERRWRVRPSDVDEMAVLGASLLSASASLVRPGGTVVYSTCTVSERENSRVIEAFLSCEAGSAFRTRKAGPLVPDHWAGDVTPEGWLQVVPGVGGPDGHFVAVLERVV